MNILHTSDWHIGQRLHGKDREQEHLLFFQWLTEFIRSEKVEALLVSGDIFDVGYPSNSALKLYYRFLTGLIQTPCRYVIITGGNHDYVSTLEAPADVLKALNVFVIGGARENIEEEIIRLLDEQDNLAAVIGAVPFLRDKDIRQVNAGESYEDRVKAVNGGIIKHYTRLAGLTADEQVPVIAMGHLYVQGAGLSDSERDIHIGNLAGVEVGSFQENFDYVALGHIHRPQKLDHTGHVRYSGSPLPLSFSERKDHKQVILLQTDKERITEIKPVEVPSFRKLVSFRGTLDEVTFAINSFEKGSELTDWAELKVEEPIADPAIRQAFEKLVDEVNQQQNGLEIIKPHLRFTQVAGNSAQLYDEAVSLADLEVKEVFDKLLENQQLTGNGELKQSFDELLDQLYHQEEELKSQN
ncbi:exonuclease subunit SbcD [Marinilabiliaceae bacterium JC017]|nr:exonuclease subunit SbcD [Marinilabiliaceae bacterium JC017]